ncbi:hypothetical protein [Salegentibacter chungangensis]|uniref:DUF1795 domain-containing protein n=1 Tax=Salegentibacter chungangensis TaxID=1335724 RepID=A0ABW3NS15_9FLAO
MKRLSILFFVLLGLNAYAQEDYVLQLNDSTYSISLDKEYSFPVDGKSISFKIVSKDTLSYEDDFFSFNYPNDFKVSKMKIDEGMEQVMLMTAEGSGILIQKYSTINPTMMNEMLLNEVTKESLNYGFKMTREDYTRKLKSGQELEVSKAILRYKDEVNTYEIASIGRKDEGILVMTMTMDETINEQGTRIIDMMWNSLEYK